MTKKGNSKVSKVKSIPKTQPLYSFYSDVFITRWTKGNMFLEFAQAPENDNGLLPSCRIYVPPIFLKDIIENLGKTVKEYEKKFGKIEE